MEDILAGSLQQLTALVSRVGTFRSKRRFCPECYAESNFSLHGHALWEFDVVKACPIHGVRLIEECCGDPSMRTFPRQKVVLTGVCRRCGSVGMACNKSQAIKASATDVWVSQQVGDLVAYASAGGALSRTVLLEGIRRCSEPLGSKKAMARAIGITPVYFNSFTEGGNRRPRLQVLLAMASISSVSLLSIFRGNPMPGCRPMQAYQAPRLARTERELAPGLHRKIEELTVHYRSVEECRDSGAVIAQALGVTTKHLVAYHPELWRLILAAHRRYKDREKQARYGEARQRVRVAIYKAVALNEPLTEEVIMRLAHVRGFIRLKMQKVLHGVLSEYLSRLKA